MSSLRRHPSARLTPSSGQARRHRRPSPGDAVELAGRTAQGGQRPPHPGRQASGRKDVPHDGRSAGQGLHRRPRRPRLPLGQPGRGDGATAPPAQGLRHPEIPLPGGKIPDGPRRLRLAPPPRPRRLAGHENPPRRIQVRHPSRRKGRAARPCRAPQAGQHPAEPQQTRRGHPRRGGGEAPLPAQPRAPLLRGRRLHLGQNLLRLLPLQRHLLRVDRIRNPKTSP